VVAEKLVGGDIDGEDAGLVLQERLTPFSPISEIFESSIGSSIPAQEKALLSGLGPDVVGGDFTVANDITSRGSGHDFQPCPVGFCGMRRKLCRREG
jgi:hypothetical protein